MVATNNRNSKDGVEKIRGDTTLKKGPWTTGEDAILMEYVRKHGEGNWNAVQRNCGLSRCGKSCRLRWANHLRPNLKKGSFTPDEERLIIELHSKIGNKWARMASQLPGRTDNEIKNYWNTRVKRLQRAGLPIYPDHITHYNYQNNHTSQQTNLNSSISPPPYPSQFNTSISFLNPVINYPTMVSPSFFPHFNNRVISNLPMPLVTPISPFALPPSTLFRNDFRIGGQFSPFGLVNDPENIELSSIQTQTGSMHLSTSASSATSDSGRGDDNVIAPHGEGYFDINANEGNNSGLLETLLEESNALAQAQKLKRGDLFGNGKWKEISEEGDSSGGTNSSPLHSSCGMEKEPMEEMNQLDNDLSSLLNNFTPVSDWYDTTTTANDNTHKEQKSELVLETTTSKDPKWDRGSCCWNNMPSIC